MRQKNIISILSLCLLLAGCSKKSTTADSKNSENQNSHLTASQRTDKTTDKKSDNSTSHTSESNVPTEKELSQEDIDLVSGKSITLTTDYNLKITVEKGLETSVENHESKTTTRMSDGFYQETVTSKEVTDEDTYEIGDVTTKTGYFRDDKGIACYYTDPDINNTVAIAPVYDSNYKEMKFDDLIFQNVLGSLEAEDFTYDKTVDEKDYFAYDYFSISDRNALQRFNDVFRMTINPNTHPTLSTFQNAFQAGNIRLKEAYVITDNRDIVGYGGTYSMSLDLADFGSVGKAKFEASFATDIAAVNETTVTMEDIEVKPYSIKSDEKDYFDTLDKALKELREGSYTYSSQYKDESGILLRESKGYITEEGYSLYDYYRTYKAGNIKNTKTIYTSLDGKYTLVCTSTETNGKESKTPYSCEVSRNEGGEIVATFTYDPTTAQVGHGKDWPYDGSNKLLFQENGKTLKLDLSSATNPEISIKGEFIYSGTLNETTDIQLSSEVYSGVHKVNENDCDYYSSEEGNKIAKGEYKVLSQRSGLPTFQFAKELFDYEEKNDEDYHFTLKKELNPAYVATVLTTDSSASDATTLELTVSKAGVFKGFTYNTKEGKYVEDFSNIKSTSSIPLETADFSSYSTFTTVKNYAEMKDIIDSNGNALKETGKDLLENLYGKNTNLDSINIFSSELVQKLYRYTILNNVNNNLYIVLSTEGNDSEKAYQLLGEIKKDLKDKLSLDFVDSTDGSMMTTAKILGGKGTMRIYVSSLTSSKVLIIRLGK